MPEIIAEILEKYGLVGAIVIALILLAHNYRPIIEKMVDRERATRHPAEAALEEISAHFKANNQQIAMVGEQVRELVDVTSSIKDHVASLRDLAGHIRVDIASRH